MRKSETPTIGDPITYGPYSLFLTPAQGAKETHTDVELALDGQPFNPDGTDLDGFSIYFQPEGKTFTARSMANEIVDQMKVKLNSLTKIDRTPKAGRSVDV